MTATAKEVAPGIRWTEGDVEIDAPLIARGLNLPTEQLVAEMRRGVVYSTSERGIGEDEGRSRLTFRYRSRVFRLIVTTSGEVVGEDISGSEDLRGGVRIKRASPHKIHRIAEALEARMKEDVAAGRPMLSALCVSKIQPGIPGRGFFLMAEVLGVFFGDPAGLEASAFHAIELQRVFLFYGNQPRPLVPAAF